MGGLREGMNEDGDGGCEAKGGWGWKSAEGWDMNS